MTEKNKKILLITAFLGVSIAVFAKKTPETPTDDNYDNTPDTQKPSGVTYAVFNKNFGNIKNKGKIYNGEISANESTYKKFRTWQYGAAALIAHVQRYIKGVFVGKLDTISLIINTYAPPSENNTAYYISFVERETGINRNTKLNANDKETMWKICDAIAKMEDRTAAKNFTRILFDAAFPIAQTQNN